MTERAASEPSGTDSAREAVARSDAREAKPWREPTWTVGRVFLVLLASTVLTVALTWLPNMLVSAANKSASACFDAQDEAHSAEPSDCSQGGKLFWPKLVPWTRSRALAAERWIARGVGRREIVRRAAVELDANGRDEQAKALLASADDEGVPLNGLMEAGAFDVLARAALPQPQSEDDVVYPLLAAATLGLPDELAAAAKREPAPGDFLWTANARRGAFLCLLGEKEAGRAALAAAGSQAAVGLGFRPLPAQMAAIACGADDDGAALGDVLSYGVQGIARTRLLDPAYMKGRRRAAVDRLLGAARYSRDFARSSRTASRSTTTCCSARPSAASRVRRAT